MDAPRAVPRDLSNYEVVVVPGHHLDQVGQLRRQMFDDALPSPHDVARTRWLYADNPAGPADVLALRLRGGPWVGMVAVVPRKLYLDGTVHHAAYLCDFFVHPQHRTLLPALMLQKTARQRLAATGRAYYAIPNARSLPIFRRLGADRVLQRFRWARPLRFRPFLARRGLRAAAILAPPLDAFGRLVDLARSRLDRGFRAEWIDHVDERFDRLWSALPKTGLAIGDRSGAYLRWRFWDEPGHRNRALGLIDRRSGCMVSCMIGECTEDEFTIRDLIFDPADERLTAMLAHALLAIRRTGVAVAGVRIAGTDALMEALSRAGFRPRDPESVFIRDLPASSSSTWILTTADEDI